MQVDDAEYTIEDAGNDATAVANAEIEEVSTIEQETIEPSTSVALELPPTGHQLFSFATQLETMVRRCEKSDEPGMGAWGPVTQHLKSAASSLRGAIGHTL